MRRIDEMHSPAQAWQSKPSYLGPSLITVETLAGFVGDFALYTNLKMSELQIAQTNMRACLKLAGGSEVLSVPRNNGLPFKYPFLVVSIFTRIIFQSGHTFELFLVSADRRRFCFLDRFGFRGVFYLPGN